MRPGQLQKSCVGRGACRQERAYSVCHAAQLRTSRRLLCLYQALFKPIYKPLTAKILCVQANPGSMYRKCKPCRHKFKQNGIIGCQSCFLFTVPQYAGDITNSRVIVKAWSLFACSIQNGRGRNQSVNFWHLFLGVCTINSIFYIRNFFMAAKMYQAHRTFS